MSGKFPTDGRFSQILDTKQLQFSKNHWELQLRFSNVFLFIYFLFIYEKPPPITLSITYYTLYPTLSACPALLICEHPIRAAPLCSAPLCSAPLVVWVRSHYKRSGAARLVAALILIRFSMLVVWTAERLYIANCIRINAATNRSACSVFEP